MRYHDLQLVLNSAVNTAQMRQMVLLRVRKFAENNPGGVRLPEVERFCI